MSSPEKSGDQAPRRDLLLLGAGSDPWRTQVGTTSGAEEPETEFPTAEARPDRKALNLAQRLDERFSGLTTMLVTADAIGLALAIATLGVSWRAALLMVLTVVPCRVSARLYRRRLRLSYFDDLSRSLASVFAALGMSVGIAQLAGLGDLERQTVAAIAVFVGVAEFMRIMAFAFARWVRRNYNRGNRTLVLGANRLGFELIETMKEYPEFGLLPVGILDPEQVPMRGPGLADAIIRNRVGTIVLASGDSGNSANLDAAITAHRLGCTILLIPRMSELYHDGTDVERLRHYPLVRVPIDPSHRPAWHVKRLFDIIFAGVAFALALPIMAVCSLAILLESGRPVLFAQTRVGFDGEPFRIYKLRSVTNNSAEEQDTTWSVTRDSRVGKVGRILRRTSLDELPQLWNIIRGDMSLVGPRPERPGFVRLFSAKHDIYFARHRVEVGLTGLAQVNGLRGDTSIADRARYDNYYIANWSLWLDLKIILLTAREVFRRGER